MNRNREQAAEAFEARKKIVAERILKNLSRSSAHSDMGALQRIELAYQLAGELLAQPLNSEAPGAFPGLTPDGFFPDLPDGE